LTFGKPDREYLEKVVFRQLGARRREVIVGPTFGVDNAVVRLGNGRVLVVTADPLSYIPALGPANSAWLSVNLIASDLATSGFPPQYGIFDFNLPPSMTNIQFTDYWKNFHRECDKLGLAIIGGHTGRYQGCDYTIIGGGSMFAIGSEENYLTSLMGQPRDDIILTKGAAIEATAVLARSFPRTVRQAIGTEAFLKARRYLRKVSTVKDSLTAVSVGVHRKGVTAMHDVTEGGVIAAAFELAHASQLGAEIDLTKVSISPETNAICQLFRIDPLTSLSEGSLIITCRPERTGKLLTKLRSARIAAHVVGQLTRAKGLRGFDSRGRSMKLRYPKFDPYWRAYSRGVERRLK